MKTTVIIPTRNEEKNIATLVTLLKKQKVDEIIVVDDGSKDNTAQEAKKHGAEVIRHQKNQGKGQSILDATAKAKNPLLILMDGDLQHDPSDIPKFKKAAEKNDLVLGYRKLEKYPLHRQISNWAVKKAIQINTKKKYRDALCGYRAIWKQKMLKLNIKAKKYDIEIDILKKASEKNYKIKEVPIKTVFHGKSKMRAKDFLQLSIKTAKILLGL